MIKKLEEKIMDRKKLNQYLLIIFLKLFSELIKI